MYCHSEIDDYRIEFTEYANVSQVKYVLFCIELSFSGIYMRYTRVAFKNSLLTLWIEPCTNVSLSICGQRRPSSDSASGTI